MNAGKITRKRSEGNFTVLANSMLQNKELSWKARGLLSFLLSLPDDWQIYKTELQSHSVEDGRDSTSAGFEELVHAGYIVTMKIRNERGHLLGYNYDVYDAPVVTTGRPITENPKTDNPVTGKPITENPSLQKTNKDKELSKQKDGAVAPTLGAEGKVDENDLEDKAQSAPNAPPVAQPPPIELPFGEEFRAVWAHWLDYRKELKLKAYKPIGLKAQLTRLQALCGNDEGVAIQIINQSISQNYQGLFALKNDHRNERTNQTRYNGSESNKSGSTPGSSKRTAFIAPGALRRSGT